MLPAAGDWYALAPAHRIRFFGARPATVFSGRSPPVDYHWEQTGVVARSTLLSHFFPLLCGQLVGSGGGGRVCRRWRTD